MKTYNAIRPKWMRLVSGLMAGMFLPLSFAGQASAKILFEDDLYLNVQSEGMILDSNNNVIPAAAATVAIQDVTVTASAVGTAGNSQTVTRVLADNSSGTCAVTGGTGTGVITITCDDGTTSLDPGVTTDLQAAIDGEALFVATGGSGTAVTAGGPTSLSGGADGDITLQFGNTGATDGTMKYNTTTNDLTIDTNGDDVNFSDDNLTTTGGLNADGNITLGAAGSSVQVDSSTWDISSAGVASGLTGITSTGAINFSGASSLSLAAVAGPANPATCTEGDIVYNQNTNTTYICTATNTWTALASGTTDFEAVYGADGDQTLTTSNGNFTIAAGSGIINENATGGINLNTSINGAVNIGTGTSTGTVTIGGTGAQAIAVGDGAGAKTVTIGSSNTTSTTTLLSGSGGLNFNVNNNQATNIGTGTTTGTVSIGGGSNDVTVNGKVVGITSTGAGNDITLTGADDIIFDDAQLTGIVQMSDADTDWAATLATNGIVDNINSFTLTTAGNGASNVGINDAGGYTAQTDVEGALQEIYGQVGSNADNVEDMTFYPEYPDATIYPDGTTNRGTLESFYDATAQTGYYDWTSTNAITQDMGVRFEFVLPPDFSAPGNFTYQYRTGTATQADNNVEMRVYNKTDAMTLCDSDTSNVNAGAWATGTLSALATGCTGGNALNAGDVVVVEVKFFDNSGGADYADVGYLKLDYTN